MLNKLDIVVIILGIVSIINIIGCILIIALRVKVKKKVNRVIERNNKKDRNSHAEQHDIFARNNNYYQNNSDEPEIDGKELKGVNSNSAFGVVEPHIVIKSRTVYEPKQLDKPLRFNNKNIGSIKGEIRGYLIFDEYSITKLRKSLDWGEKTQRNQVEQGGILLGNIALYKSEVYCFIKDILLAKTKGMPAFVEFTNEMWKDMQSELDLLNETKSKDDKLVILGWFHTHPNNLSVFMSGTDMETQRLNFPLEWQVALVMNPHKNVYRAFFGRDAVEGEIIFPVEENRIERDSDGISK